MDTEVFQLIPIERISVKEQVRSEFNNIDELANSLKVQGQQVPITVYPSPNRDGDFIIYHGERRWRAAKQAGLTTMTAVIVPAPETEADRICCQLIENLLRESMSPMEVAKAFDALRQDGLRQNEIASKTGFSPSLVSRYLSLADIDPDLAVFVNERSLEDLIAIDHIKRACRVDKIRTLAAIEDLRNEAIEQAQRDGTPGTKPEAFRITRRMAKKIATDICLCQAATKTVDPNALPPPDTAMHLAPRGGSADGSGGSSSSKSAGKSAKAPKKSGKEQINDAPPFMAPPPAFETEPDENGAVAVGNSSWKKLDAKEESSADKSDQTLETETVGKDGVMSSASSPPMTVSRNINLDELPEGCRLTKDGRTARIRVNIWTTNEINGDMMQQSGWLETNVVCDDSNFCCVKLDSGLYLDFAVESIAIAAVCDAD